MSFLILVSSSLTLRHAFLVTHCYLLWLFVSAHETFKYESVEFDSQLFGTYHAYGTMVWRSHLWYFRHTVGRRLLHLISVGLIQFLRIFFFFFFYWSFNWWLQFPRGRYKCDGIFWRLHGQSGPSRFRFCLELDFKILASLFGFFGRTSRQKCFL